MRVNAHAKIIIIQASLIGSMLALTPKPVFAQRISSPGNYSNLILDNLPEQSMGTAAYLPSGTSSFTSSTFTNNKANSGGAIYNTGNLTISNSTFSGNTAGQNGGAIYHHSGIMTIGAEVSFSDNSITNSSSNNMRGGAIYSTGTMNFTSNVTFTNNKVIGATNDGGAVNNHGTITFQSTSNFTGNFATDAGGAILNNIGKGLTFNAAATFKNNTANNVGGAIFNQSGTLKLLGTSNLFEGNVANGSGGGAIVNSSHGGGGTVTIGASSTFKSNATAGNGGAINQYGGLFTLGANTSFEGNSAGISGGAIYANTSLTIGNNATFTNNSSVVYGGAIHNSSSLSIGTNSTFTGNSAGSDGGAIFNEGTLTLGSTSSFSNNSAFYAGGAIYNNAGTLTINSGATFTSNSAETHGGAIYNKTTPLQISGSNIVFSNNSVTGTSARGGAIYSTSSVSLGGTTFSNNTATQYGGAIYATGSISVDSNSSFTGNQGQNGGAIYQSSGTLTVSGSNILFDANTAANSGGAIYAGGATTIDGAEFKNNTVTALEARGGAIYSTANLTITNSLFEANKTTFVSEFSRGGALSSTSTASINNSIFKNNYAADYGGAIDSIGVTSILNIGSNTSFIGNSVIKGGGAILKDHGNLSISGADIVFDSNNASSGGAIYLWHVSSANIGGSTFSNNIATSNGGAILSYDSAISVASNSVFTGNKASSGGAIYLDATSSLAIGEGSLFSSNIASSKGGAIYNKGTLTLTTGSNDIIFTGNTASGVGNDIYLEYGSSLNIKGTGSVTFAGGIAGDKTDSSKTYQVNVSESATLNIDNLKVKLDHGTVTFDGNSTLAVGINSLSDFGSISAASFTSAATSNISFFVTDPFSIESGNFQIIDSTSLDNNFKIKENPMYKINYVGNGTYSLLSLTRAQIVQNLIDWGANSNQIRVINAAFDTNKNSGHTKADNFIRNLYTQLQLNTHEGLKAVDQIMPNISQLSSSITANLHQNIFANANDRLLHLHKAEFDAEQPRFTSPWAQKIDTDLDYNYKHNELGLKGTVSGFAAGVDRKNSKSAFGFGYAFTEPDFVSVTNNIKGEAHNVFFYTQYAPSEVYYTISAYAGMTQYELNGITLGIDNHAKYNNFNYGAGFRMGYVGERFSPYLQVLYSHLIQNKYEDELGQTIYKTSSDIVSLDVGATYGRIFKLNHLQLSPQLFFGATYDIMPGTLNADVQMVGGGAYELIGEDLPPLGIKLGGKMDLLFFEKISILVNYGVDLRDDYTNKTLSLTAQFKL